MQRPCIFHAKWRGRCGIRRGRTEPGAFGTGSVVAVVVVAVVLVLAEVLVVVMVVRYCHWWHWW